MPRSGEAEFAVAQSLQRIAHRRRSLEVEVRGRGLHLPFETYDLGVEFRLGPEYLSLVRCWCHVVALVDAAHHVVDLTNHRFGRDAVFRVVGLL